MTDFDSIWRTQDEIRTVVNAVLGECIWNLAYETRLVSSAGLEYDATNVGVGSSNLSRVTNIALWCNG